MQNVIAAVALAAIFSAAAVGWSLAGDTDLMAKRVAAMNVTEHGR
jgi:hypothetical protein